MGLFHTFKIILKNLPSRRRKELWAIFAVMVFVACLETITVGIIALFASAVSDPSVVLNSVYWSLFREIIHVEVLYHPKGLLIFLSILVVCLVLLKNVFQALVVYWNSLFTSMVNGDWGKMILKGFLEMPYVWHLHRNSADLILAVQWRSHIGHGFVNGALTVLCDILLVSFMLVLLLVVEPAISFLNILVFGGVAFVIYSKVRVALDRCANRVSQYDQGINRDVTKGLHGIKEVKIFGQRRSFLRDFDEDVSAYARLWARLIFLGRAPVLILEAVGFLMLTTAITFMLFVSEASAARVTGTIALLAVTAWRVLPALNRILSGSTEMRRSLPFVGRLIQYLREVEAKSEDRSLAPFKQDVILEFQKEVRFEHVYFTYDHTQFNQLQDICLVIPKGKTVGIIGPSGAGKSTLVDILIGLLRPTGGRIFLDGVAIDNENRATWMNKIGYVPQSPYIFDGTLAENIAFVLKDQEIDPERVLSCCQMASIDFLPNLPDGIDTLIGERGMRLSGGERQRVAIARALYRDPEVLIFDEATSSLDSSSEKAIQNTIYGFKGKQTLIIIAHRLSTVEECDFLIWIEKGKIKKIGPPSDVLSSYVNYGDEVELVGQS